MEKRSSSDADTNNSRSSCDLEKTSFLNSHFIKGTRGRRGIIWISLLNLFIFMLSALTLVCAVFSQNAPSNHSAAKLLEDFGLFCE